MKLKHEWDELRRTSYVICPKCRSRAYIDIEPFEGSGYWCKKCKKYLDFKGIC